MKILVTGSAGLVGSQVIQDLSQTEYEIYSGYHSAKPHLGIPVFMDLENLEQVKTSVKKVEPEIIIHLAAMTNVDQCERDKTLARKINTQATEILAKQASIMDSFLVYVSTDYVFDGKKGMKTETDDTNPIDYYGQTKLEGEKGVIDSSSKWCIARTSTPYGIHSSKKTFPLWVIENLSQNKTINVVTDQFTSPTYVPNLSKMLIEIAQRKIEGLFHVSGSSRISRFSMAEEVAQKMNLDLKLLKKISVDDLNWFAKRPKDSSLDVSKISKILKEKPMNVNLGLEKLISELKND